MTKVAWLLTVGLFLIACSTEAQGETIYFLVAELDPFHYDSYVLPLDDPADIAAARNLIERGPLNVSERIVVARVALGADGVNRNYFSPYQTWNWHVAEFLGFAELTAEILDGWPTYLESTVPGWAPNSEPTIGFWSYSVVAELETVPEPDSAILLATGVASIAASIVWRRRLRRRNLAHCHTTETHA